MKKNILKGLIIGTAKILPGVSGSMLAISLGVYEKMLGIIADLRNITWCKFRYLSSLVIGVFIGISFFSRGVKWLLETFYLPTMLLFIGLIIGGLPGMLSEIKSGRLRKSYLLVFIISLTLSYVLVQIGSVGESVNGNAFIYFGLGLLEAFSSIVPGISGTAIFMSLGCYDLLLSFFSNMFSPSYFKFGIFFMLGVIVGIFILAKVITYLLKFHKCVTYYAIAGFMASSLVMMGQAAFTRPFVWPELVLGVILFYIGYRATIKINNLLASS